MGVDYSATVGWGLALEEMPSVITTDEWFDDEEIDGWLTERGYEHIEYEKGGDWMSGEYIHLFYLKWTKQRLDWRYDNGVVAFDNVELVDAVVTEFRRLCNELDVPWPSSLSWKLIFNVS